jgi:hypothetical protein
VKNLASPLCRNFLIMGMHCNQWRYGLQLGPKCRITLLLSGQGMLAWLLHCKRHDSMPWSVVAVCYA